MVNAQRGEVPLVVDGKALVMRLSLGALAELETRLGASGLIGLAERFETGAFRGEDLIALLAAGLRGAGGDVSETEVADMAFDGGAVGAARAASQLLAATFGGRAE
jgi:hypothetical protein